MKPPAPDHTPHVITIDGPAGSGKSTTARMLAARLKWLHLDSGATYRAVAAVAQMRGIGSDDADALTELADQISLEIRVTDDGQRVLADGTDVTEMIRTPEVSRASSPVSAVPAVRHRLVKLQRELAAEQNTVAEGRDMGTVVFPDAKVKVYLLASAQARAERRLKDFEGQKRQLTFEEVLEEIQERDERDSNRAMSPLRPADDAYIIHTDNLSPEEVVDRIVSYYVDATL